ncbi:MAG: hypothetical protein KH135_01855, partial [Firmicutes bacterium]|nr:hypothetical protein [Bacillota bacterium]
MSGLVIGIIVGMIVFGFLLFRIESFIQFMNMDVAKYKLFAIYSVLQLFIQLIFAFILEKLYYEGKNTLANQYSLRFNLLNFVVLIGSALLIPNQVIVVIVTLSAIFIYMLVILFRSLERFHFHFQIFHFIKYNSVDLFNNIAFFFIFLFGLSNALEYGSEYALAITFISLITDTQWDSFEAISTTAKIDASKNQFCYNQHKKNAYQLLAILMGSSIFMFFLLYQFYQLNFTITMIFFGFEVINYLIYPIYRIQTCYLQLEYSALKTTTNKIFSCILRMGFSFLKTPYCTGLGQVCSSLYQLLSIQYLFHKNYRVLEDGTVLKKNELVKEKLKTLEEA